MFAPLLQVHFTQKRAKILRTSAAWISEARAFYSGLEYGGQQRVEEFCSMVATVTAGVAQELDRLCGEQSEGAVGDGGSSGSGELCDALDERSIDQALWTQSSSNHFGGMAYEEEYGDDYGDEYGDDYGGGHANAVEQGGAHGDEHDEHAAPHPDKMQKLLELPPLLTQQQQQQLALLKTMNGADEEDIAMEEIDKRNEKMLEEALAASAAGAGGGSEHEHADGDEEEEDDGDGWSSTSFCDVFGNGKGKGEGGKGKGGMGKGMVMVMGKGKGMGVGKGIGKGMAGQLPPGLLSMGKGMKVQAPWSKHQHAAHPHAFAGAGQTLTGEAVQSVQPVPSPPSLSNAELEKRNQDTRAAREARLTRFGGGKCQ
jgi:hypothetical protein